MFRWSNITLIEIAPSSSGVMIKIYGYKQSGLMKAIDVSAITASFSHLSWY